MLRTNIVLLAFVQNLFNSNHKSILEALDAANANVVNETQYGQKPELTCTRLAPFSFPLVQGKADKASKFPSFSGDKQPDKHAASNGDKRPFDKYGDQYDDDEYDEYTQPKWYRDEDSSPAAMMAAHMKDLFNSPGYDDHGKVGAADTTLLPADESPAYTIASGLLQTWQGQHYTLL